MTVLDRIAAVDPALHAMVSVDPGATGGPGPLAGVAVAVKDIVDVAGWPTRAGSATRACVAPAARDAAIVARLRAAGACVVGKTTTTEFAAMDPTATVNPWHAGATPGGSSSGSAAIVGSGAVPLAVGTQTAGSLCRPAAYCGIAAIKPSWGLLPTDGIVPLAPSFDTVGLLARTVAGCAVAFAAVGGPAPQPVTSATLGVELPACSPAAAALLARVAAAAAALGFTVVPLLAPDRGRVVALHRTVMAAEAFAAHAPVAEDPRLGPRIRELLALGATVTSSVLAAAQEELTALRGSHWAALAGVDAVLTVPVPGPAPLSLATTGPADLLVPWSAFHGPLVVVPGVLDETGLPLATMVAAAPGRDAVAVGVAAALAEIVDELPERAW